jgi:signal transduction protein with GAF and PtsI domain
MEGTVPRCFEKDNVLGTASVLRNLSALSRSIQEVDVSNDSFEIILKLVGEIIDFRSASVFVVSGESGKLEEICTIGHSVDLIDFVEFDMGSGISAWVAKKRRPILLNHLRKSRGGVHVRSFLSVPIVFGDEIIGVINLAHDDTEAFNEYDAEILGIVSTLFALLSERINHLKCLNAATNEIDSLKEQLRNARFEISREDGVQRGNDASEALGTRLANSLAIIAGNAQFLLMTMKNSSNSVIRRLKAINKEAADIMEITSRRGTGQNADRGFLKVLTDDNET